MGRPQVTQPLQGGTLEQGVHIGLPLKITGIVFWGLVAIGLVLVAEAIHWLQRDMDKAQLEQTRQASLMVEALFLQGGPAAIDTSQPQLDRLVRRTNIIGIRVHTGLNSIAAGESDAHLTLYTHNFTVTTTAGESTDVIT